MNLIILSGKAQSGKDTSAEYLIDVLKNQNCKRYSFATPLKEFLHKVFGIPKEMLWGTDEQKNQLTHIKWNQLPLDSEHIFELKQASGSQSEYLTARELMMVFGSDICRRMYNDCWVNATYQDMIKDHSEYSFISDARFPNEISFFKDKPINSLVIRLSRNLFDKKHKSETALDNFDWYTECNYGAFIDNRKTSLAEKNRLLSEVLACFQVATDENTSKVLIGNSNNCSILKLDARIREYIITTPFFFRRDGVLYILDGREVYNRIINGNLQNADVYRVQEEIQEINNI